ncbi:hypothetical protein [Aquabacterium sp. CECT 9606]|uniref:hypothetical protein n=1 Tax=Aquabacterium sp. CECT 9606 TaxID=2845822 RepID=UPI001E59A7CF|nr:hypothetical protein [Aquabacterium sp. CECT 9606]CAH0354820.1 hypothetical protein AQB9606_03958 [Aquabacterium sp. CECT 9606]
MDNDSLYKQIERLQAVVKHASGDFGTLAGAKAQVCEFLRQFAGPKSSFLQVANSASGSLSNYATMLTSSLENYRDYLRAGLATAVSPQRQAQLDVVSDFLEQAHNLLRSKAVHPAAAIVLIGATLEEFLRTWIESSALSLGQRKPSIDSYGQVLLAEELITKQDMKDIIAWGGLRNHAAHGEWEEVSDRTRASIMLDGVNLFLRKYSQS